MGWEARLRTGTRQGARADRRVYIAACFGLVAMSALAAGLTLALFSLDKMDLEVLKISGDKRQARACVLACVVATTPLPPGPSPCRHFPALRSHSYT
jgi:hypothetical protein